MCRKIVDFVFIYKKITTYFDLSAYYDTTQEVCYAICWCVVCYLMMFHSCDVSNVFQNETKMKNEIRNVLNIDQLDRRIKLIVVYSLPHNIYTLWR